MAAAAGVIKKMKKKEAQELEGVLQVAFAACACETAHCAWERFCSCCVCFSLSSPCDCCAGHACAAWGRCHTKSPRSSVGCSGGFVQVVRRQLLQRQEGQCIAAAADALRGACGECSRRSRYCRLCIGGDTVTLAHVSCVCDSFDSCIHPSVCCRFFITAFGSCCCLFRR